jgi:hypothetical protein
VASRTWPHRSPPGVALGDPEACDAPPTAEHPMTLLAVADVCVPFCQRYVARLGTFAFGGGRPAGGLASTACLARPPSGTSPECWRVASDSPLALARYRPDVSLSWALPQALACAGLRLPRGMRLAPTRRGARPLRGPREGPPFPAFMVRLLRAVLSTGFLGRACRSISTVAGAFSCVLLTPACPPLALGQPSRWLHHPFTCAAHRGLRDGLPGWRLPGVRR